MVERVFAWFIHYMPLAGGVAIAAYVTADSFWAGMWFLGLVVVLFLSGRESGRSDAELHTADTHRFFLVSEPKCFEPLEVASFEDPAIEETLAATTGTAGDLVLLLHRRGYRVHTASMGAVTMADWSVMIVLQWQADHWRIVWPAGDFPSGRGRRRKPVEDEDTEPGLVPAWGVA